MLTNRCLKVSLVIDNIKILEIQKQKGISILDSSSGIIKNKFTRNGRRTVQKHTQSEQINIAETLIVFSKQRCE
jgi:hypothetical protein